MQKLHEAVSVNVDSGISLVPDDLYSDGDQHLSTLRQGQHLSSLFVHNEMHTCSMNLQALPFNNTLWHQSWRLDGVGTLYCYTLSHSSFTNK